MTDLVSLVCKCCGLNFALDFVGEVANGWPLTALFLRKVKEQTSDVCKKKSVLRSLECCAVVSCLTFYVYFMPPHTQTNQHDDV
jgi:hypothetical protein